MSAGYPFSAIVGLADLRLALLLNAVSPGVGGVLVRGEKGTAKSTMVRALAALLPDTAAVSGCRFSCDPAAPDPACPDGPHDAAAPGETRRARLVELPVGATEDRLVGSLDLERALAEGVKAYEPGLLAAAHRGLLYVDEVNLLHDHLVDLLLDAAAMGTAHVEREGVSVRHAARFLLVGTMNPEEGELRPQLLDRFGLTVEVAASREPRERAEVVRRRLAYEADPDGFAARWAEHDAALALRIEAARALLPDVVLPDAELERVARVCAAFEVDGLRADLVTARTAIALAAWHGRTEVEASDVRQAAQLALPHRRRRNPFDAPGLDQDKLDEALRDEPEPDLPDDPDPDPEPDGPDGSGGSDRPDGPGGPGGPDQDGPGGGGPGGGPAPQETAPPEPPRNASSDAPAAEQPPPARESTAAAAAPEQPAVAASEPFRARLLAVPGLGQGAAGRRSRAETGTGRTTGDRRPSGPVARLHLVGTVRAAAPHQAARGRRGPGLVLRRDDVREAVREGREGNLVLFVVDASGSMAARARMRTVKGAVLSLLLDAYQRRDKVGLVTFRGAGAELALPPTSSVEAGAARLAALPTGGRTPLAAGLLRAHEALRVEHLRDPRRRPLLVVVTDGRATHGPDPLGAARRAAGLLAAAGNASVVVDCESGPVRLGLAARLAADLGGPVLGLADLAADGLAGLVRDLRAAG
ncbi:putative cobaltochelatase [Yinghuangia soli]|uniref:Mg-protoporphyrin IX chelatase n=1 Tax=Yinghuangia soli TaxID=2908204 RepID=A0AA41TZG6_9ACTN|nr:putative cobaltochelatase [Yinghuangia soli]MCF2527491.1 putative cobaltochelatase [Yinghuangia soli]